MNFHNFDCTGYPISNSGEQNGVSGSLMAGWRWLECILDFRRACMHWESVYVWFWVTYGIVLNCSLIFSSLRNALSFSLGPLW